MRKLTVRHTILACYVGYITQAIVNNFAPLLFLTFQNRFALTLSQITSLVTVNFLTQLLVDLLAAAYVDRIGYRPCLVAAHLLCAVGLVGLGMFPFLLSPYPGLLLAVVIYAMGGGLLEVLVSPVVENCPGDGKAAAMSLLHSFYCWGMVAVVIVSTVLLNLFGTDRWMLIGYLWALVPLCNAGAFCVVPLAEVQEEGDSLPVSGLFREKIFWVLALLMVCAGASELAMSQWASAFAERSLGVSKTVGDLAGPCFFAVFMGLARVLYAKLSRTVSLERYMLACAGLCIVSYVLAIAPLPALVNLLGCGLCGFSVGVFWPGTISLATHRCRLRGTSLFGLLALAGDVGCSLGPTVVGTVSSLWGDQLKVGLCAAMVFPLVILLGIAWLQYMMRKKRA